ncbi:MAG TPA: polyprenyl synthetase family protein [Spirochaetales bacterium]|nr:polyprenyl synthetase family protein [Spirochaetales bacterium]
MTEFWQDSPEIAASLEKVAALMDQSVRGSDFPLEEAVASIVASNGKMLRPALILIGAGFGRRGYEERILPLAAAVELLHVSTLIHDDVIDEAELRRGVPTIHSRFGAKEAVLAGDWLFARCFLLAAESAGPGNAKALARLITAICAAEIRQDLDKGSYSPSVRSYLRKIAGKTAALFSLSLHVGATESKAPPPVAERLRRAGYDIGMAFQVIDDILDFESSEGTMRKPVGRDVAEGLCTLPLIHALRADGAGMRALLSRLPRPGRADRAEAGAREEALARGDAVARDEAVAAILARASELGGVEAARRDAARFTARAQAEIARLPRCEAREELARVADKLLSRKY